MASKAAVLYDPEGKLATLEHVEKELVPALRARGVLTIPFSIDALARSPQAGVTMRHFGRGLEPPPAMFRRLEGLLLFTAAHGGPNLHLAMRLRAKGAAKPEGKIRLISDTAQWGVQAIGISGDALVDVSELGKPDERGGWNVVAGARFQPVEGFVGLALYGAASGVLVEWAAVSQADV